MENELIEVTQDTVLELRSKGLTRQANLILKTRKKWLKEQRRIDKKLANRQAHRVYRHLAKLRFGHFSNYFYKKIHTKRAYRFAAQFYRNQEIRRFKELCYAAKCAKIKKLKKEGFAVYD